MQSTLAAPNPLAPSKYRRMRLMQEGKQWDIDADLPWASLASDRPLLPRCEALAHLLGLTPSETLALSQLLGLTAVQAISEHEKVLGLVKDACWLQPLRRLADAEDLIQLGEQFFKEEEKHAQAFSRYVAAFAAQRGIAAADLQQVLPQYGASSWTTKIFQLNARIGGRAIWWLVMITEEESLALFRALREAGDGVDPLFYELNRQHFEEEVRHMSYAPLMLRHLAAAGAVTGGALKRLLLKLDYSVAEALHVIWVLRQLTRLSRLQVLAPRHEFFATLAGIAEKFQALSWTKRLAIVLNDIPYVSASLNPQRHRAVRTEISRNAAAGADSVQRLLDWARQLIGAA